MRAIAGARVHHQAGRFVKHQQLLILVDDIQRQYLGAHGGVGIEPGLDHDLLAALYAIAGARRLTLEPHHPVPDPTLQARPRVLRQRDSQRLIQAQARRGRRQLEPVGLELRWHGTGQL